MRYMVQTMGELDAAPPPGEAEIVELFAGAPNATRAIGVVTAMKFQSFVKGAIVGGVAGLVVGALFVRVLRG